MSADIALAVQIASRASDLPDEDLLRGWAESALPGAAGELVIRIVDEAEAADLNQRFRDRPGPTNVLAFAGDGIAGPASDATHLGDIVICAGVVFDEAADQGKPALAHWAHIVIHGCLHLAGFDHEDRADAERMEARERELLGRFGFADPYAGA